MKKMDKNYRNRTDYIDKTLEPHLKPRMDCPSYPEYAKVYSEWLKLIDLHEEIGKKRKAAMAEYEKVKARLDAERRGETI